MVRKCKRNVKIGINKKTEGITHVCTYCGFGGITVSHHKSAKQKIERLRIPQQVQAWGTLLASYAEITQVIRLENKYLISQKVYKAVGGNFKKYERI